MPRHGGGVRNALLPIMHPSIAIVYRHRVVRDDVKLTEPALCRGGSSSRDSLVRVMMGAGPARITSGRNYSVCASVSRSGQAGIVPRAHAFTMVTRTPSIR